MRYLILLIGIAIAGCTGNKQTPESPKPTASIALPAPAAPVVNAALVESTKICTKGSEKRELQILKKGSGCTLNSLEAGKNKEEVTWDHGSKHCEYKEKKMIARLERTGFKCN